MAVSSELESKTALAEKAAEDVRKFFEDYFELTGNPVTLLINKGFKNLKFLKSLTWEYVDNFYNHLNPKEKEFDFTFVSEFDLPIYNK
eukprot:Nk52_evm18s277 gene=Nk52_evmTU18s277